MNKTNKTIAIFISLTSLILISQVLLIIFSSTSCDSDCEDEKKTNAKRAFVEVELFNQCMKLSSLNSRQSNDNVHQIINACRTTSRVQSIGLIQ